MNHTADASFASHAMFGNVIRWYHHIASYTALEMKKFSGKRLSVEDYIPGASSAAAPKSAPKAAAPKEEKKESAAEDDDMDLFGSDSEDDAANEKLKAERVAAYNEKKSASKYKIGSDDTGICLKRLLMLINTGYLLLV